MKAGDRILRSGQKKCEKIILGEKGKLKNSINLFGKKENSIEKCIKPQSLYVKTHNHMDHFVIKDHNRSKIVKKNLKDKLILIDKLDHISVHNQPIHKLEYVESKTDSKIKNCNLAKKIKNINTCRIKKDLVIHRIRHNDKNRNNYSAKKMILSGWSIIDNARSFSNISDSIINDEKTEFV